MVAAPALSSKGPQKIKMSVEAQTEVASVVNDPRKQAERGGNGDNVILIHGRWYDVTSFDHPGGPVALSLGIQRDATALFESYHALSNKELLRSHLKQLEVNEAEQSRLSKLYGMGNVAGFAGQDQDFDFSAAAAELHGASKVSGSTKADPFEVEVKQIAREYLKQEAARRRVSLKDAGKATSGKWAAMLLFTAVFLWSMAPLIRGEWYALLLTPTLAWIYMVNCFHDANHFSLHKSWRVNALVGWLVPWFSQPFFWHLQHTIGHHVYTNLPHKDPDLYHTPALRMSEDSAWHPAHQYQLYYLPYIGSQSNFALTFLQPMFWAFKHYRPDGTSLYNGVVLSRPVSRTRKLQLVSHGIITLLVLFGWPWFVLAGESFLKRLAFTFLPIGVVSMWFMAFSQVNHHSEQIVGVHDRRWYRHQVMTSQTIAPQSMLMGYLTGGLNLQIEHHLFPGINHCHLRAMQPAIEACARKHGVPYLRTDSMLRAFYELGRHVFKMGVPVQDPEGAGGSTRREKSE